MAGDSISGGLVQGGQFSANFRRELTGLDLRRYRRTRGLGLIILRTRLRGTRTMRTRATRRRPLIAARTLPVAGRTAALGPTVTAAGLIVFGHDKRIRPPRTTPQLHRFLIEYLRISAWKKCARNRKSPPTNVGGDSNVCSAVSYFSTRVGSIIGAGRLSFRVRDGSGRFPAAMAAVTLFTLFWAPPRVWWGECVLVVECVGQCWSIRVPSVVWLRAFAWCASFVSYTVFICLPMVGCV